MVFGDYKTRDWIASKGRYLSKYIDATGRPTAGFRMEVPDFLAGDFKLLEDYGYQMRQMHGRQTKRYIRCDNEELSLYMEIRLPDSPLWLRITPELARELKQQNDREEIERLKTTFRNRTADRQTNFIPRKRKAFTVPQSTATTNSEESYEQMHERINQKLIEEAANKRGRQTWTAMDDVEPADNQGDIHVVQPSPSHTRTRRTTGGLFTPSDKPRPSSGDTQASREAFNLWNPEPRGEDRP